MTALQFKQGPPGARPAGGPLHASVAAAFEILGTCQCPVRCWRRRPWRQAGHRGDWHRRISDRRCRSRDSSGWV